MEYVVTFLAALSVGTPIYLALLVGIVLALLKWRAHPQVSALALAGLGINLLTMIGGTAMSVVLPIHLTRSEGMTMPEIAVTMATISVFRCMLEAVGWGLLVAAIFIGRRPRA